MKKLNFRPTCSHSITLPAMRPTDRSTDPLAGDYLSSELSFNFDMSTGVLTDGLGFSPLSPTCLVGGIKIISLYFYKRLDPLLGRDDRVLAYSNDGYIYECPICGGVMRKITNLHFDNRPIGICYNYNSSDVIIFSDDTSGLKIYDGESVQEIVSAPPVDSMCIHYERLFITGGEANTLWFSDDFDPANWSVSLGEAGFIGMSDFRGDLQKCISFGDYLYVFRTYGITRVSAYGDQTQFSAVNLFTPSGRIIGDSVTVCGDGIIFMATDGFYHFNGNTAKSILDGYDGVIDYSYKGTKGVYFNGKSYFLVNVKDGNKSKNCLLCYDNKSGMSYIIKGANISDIALIDGETQYKLIAISDAGSHIYELKKCNSIFGEPTFRTWESKLSDFGTTYKRKLLTSITLYTDSDIAVIVSSDSQSKRFSISASDKMTRIRPNVSGDLFSFRIECDGENVRIGRIKLTFEYYRD